MKFNLKKVSIILASVVICAYGIAAVIIFSTGGLVSTSAFDYVERFTPDGIKKIDIHTTAHINLFSTDSRDIKVHLHGKYNTSVAEDIPELVAYVSDDQLNLGVRVRPSRRLFIGVREMTADLDVYIPKDSIEKVNIYSSIGSTYIENINVDQLDFKTVSGNLEIESLNSTKANIESHSGEVEIRDYTGDLKVISISGTVYVVQYNLSGDVVIRNGSGDIRLEISNNDSFIINALTESGNINLSGVNINIEEYDEKKLEGILGTGSNEIYISTDSGNIYIEGK